MFTEKEVELLQKWATADGDILLDITPQYINNQITDAIRRANKQGENIPHWTAYQLRHTAFTENVKQYGVELAAKLAGHANLDMARIYDHSTEDMLLALAEKRKG